MKSLTLTQADSAGHRALDTLQVRVLNPPPRLDFPNLTLEAGLPVQLALDTGVIDARFSLTQGPLDLAPTLHARFDGSTASGQPVSLSR